MIFFSRNLKSLREREGIKQADLAQRIGVKANTISNYEKVLVNQITLYYALS